MPADGVPGRRSTAGDGGAGRARGRRLGRGAGRGCASTNAAPPLPPAVEARPRVAVEGLALLNARATVELRAQYRVRSGDLGGGLDEERRARVAGAARPRRDRLRRQGLLAS